ncbi:unnamed protein product, partial [Fusarium langsethiae]
MIYQSENPKISFSPKQTLWSWLFDSKTFASGDGAPGFTDAITKKHISYGLLRDYATLLSSVLVAQYGLKQNDTVIVYGKNSIWWPVATLATIRVGGVACGVSPEYTVDELAYSLKTSKSKIMFATVDNIDNAHAAAAKVGMPQGNVILLESSRKGSTSIQALLQNAGSVTEVPPSQIPEGKTNSDICT